MSERRRLSRTVFNWVAVLLIAVVTAAALLAGAAVIGSDDLPGSGLSPDRFVSSGEVTATDGSLFLDRAGQPTVVGEIDNDAGNPIANVTVSATIYADGEAVGTRETSPPASTVPDGTAVPYEIRFATDVEPDEYETNVTYDDGSAVDDDLDLVDSREDGVAQDSVTISGSMRNAGDETAERPAAVVTFYDEDGTVIGTRTGRTSPLEPGETASFTVRYSTLGDVPSLAREYAEYAVVAIDDG